MSTSRIWGVQIRACLAVRRSDSVYDVLRGRLALGYVETGDICSLIFSNERYTSVDYGMSDYNHRKRHQDKARGTRDPNKRHRLGINVIILQDGGWRFVIDEAGSSINRSTGAEIESE